MITCLQVAQLLTEHYQAHGNTAVQVAAYGDGVLALLDVTGGETEHDDHGEPVLILQAGVLA